MSLEIFSSNAIRPTRVVGLGVEVGESSCESGRGRTRDGLNSVSKVEYESNYPRIDSDIRTVGLASRLARVYYLRLLPYTKDPSSESHIKYTTTARSSRE